MLQLCFYAEAISAIQGAPVSAMHVLLCVGQRRTMRPADFDAYYRVAQEPTPRLGKVNRCNGGHPPSSP